MTQPNNFQADLELSERENSNLRKHILWAAAFISPKQREELLQRLTSPIENGGVVADLEADQRASDLEIVSAIEELTDHVQVAVEKGADDNWIAKADALANRLREFTVPDRLTFHDLLKAPDKSKAARERKEFPQ